MVALHGRVCASAAFCTIGIGVVFTVVVIPSSSSSLTYMKTMTTIFVERQRAMVLLSVVAIAVTAKDITRFLSGCHYRRRRRRRRRLASLIRVCGDPSLDPIRRLLRHLLLQFRFHDLESHLEDPRPPPQGRGYFFSFGDYHAVVVYRNNSHCCSYHRCF